MARNTPSAEQISSAGAQYAGTAQRAVFRKEGEYWTVGSGESTSRLKNTRGLGYIAHLLRYPHTEFHALDLYGGIVGQREDDEGSQSTDSLLERAEDLEKSGIHFSGPGDAGEMLDEQAKAAYWSRVSELHEELEEAKRLGRVDRAEQVEEEIDALTRELSRAVGLGGRNRRAASASERARQSVTKSIKSTLERIAQSEATLGDHLSRCIKTGNFCAYRPDSGPSFAWEFAETLAESETPTPNSDPPRVHPAPQPAAPVVLDVSPFPLAERTAFVGREAERAAIRALIDRALSGRGSLVMLGGEPGVGKSRLALEMGEYASRVGFRCMVGHCYESEEPYPYLPFVELIESGLAQAASLDDFRRQLGENAPEFARVAPSLRRVFSDIPEPLELPAWQQRFYLFRSISEALGHAARTRSYLFILEDLHWADESTLALFVHLSSRITQIPVVIIGTYRDGYSDSTPALVRTLEELIRLGHRPLKLRGLPKEAVAEMLYALSKQQAPEKLVSVIFDGCQGNPFFVEELYRHLHEEGRVFDAAGQFRTDITNDQIEVPENVRLIIDRRLERFDQEERRALAAAAVIGRSFSFQLLTAISRIEVDELFNVLEKAQRMGIIVASAEGPERPFTFGHELVRQTLLAGISLPRRQRLHAAVADAIEQLYLKTLNERAGDIAEHLVKAGSFADHRRLVHYLTLSGKSALSKAAFEEARRSFLRAFSHLTEVEVRARADLSASLAIAERGLERWEAALAKLGGALEIYITLGDRRMIARSCTQLIGIFVWAGRLPEAIKTAGRCVPYLEANVSADRAHLLAARAQAHAAAGSWEPANEALSEALNVASRLSDRELTARLLGARLTMNYQFFRLREAAADGEQSRGSAHRPWERAIELQFLYQTLLYLGRLDDAAIIRDELEPLATKIGQTYSIVRCLITRAWLEFGKTPDLAKLDSVLRPVLKTDPKMPSLFWDVFAEGQLSTLDFLRGNWASAGSHADASYRLEADSFLRGAGTGTLFRQMAYEGNGIGALAVLRDKRAWLPRSGRPNTIGSWWMLALVIEGLVMLREHSQAGALYPLVRELLDTGAVVLWPIFRFTHTVAGISAAAGRRWEAAEDHFQTALRQAQTFPDRFQQAEISRFRAMMLIDRAATSDRERAFSLLREARETYTMIGMPRHIEMTRTLLDRTAGR